MLKAEAGTFIDLNENVFKAKFSIPFIPPSKQEYKDSYVPFEGELPVEADRLFLLYETLDKALKGKFIEDSLILNSDTSNKKGIVITPPKYLSEKARIRGGVYGIKFQNGIPGKDKKVASGRLILSLTYINLLKKMIKEKGLIQYLFYEIDKNNNLHSVIIQRNKGKIKVIHPFNLEIPETKKAKLQITVNSYLEGLEKVPTTIVASKVVFRKNTKGDFAIHTPHSSINIKKEDVEKLRLLIED